MLKGKSRRQKSRRKNRNARAPSLEGSTQKWAVTGSFWFFFCFLFLAFFKLSVVLLCVFWGEGGSLPCHVLNCRGQKCIVNFHTPNPTCVMSTRMKKQSTVGTPEVPCAPPSNAALCFHVKLRKSILWAHNELCINMPQNNLGNPPKSKEEVGWSPELVRVVHP